MKMKITLNRISATMFMLLVFAGGLWAQQSESSEAVDTRLVEKAVSYRLTYTPKAQRSGDRLTINLDADHSGVYFGSFTEMEGGGFYVDIDIPEGVPFNTGVFITLDNFPLWHVTVADILGTSESDNEVNLRPIGTETPEEEGSGYSNSITQPGSEGPVVSGLQGNKVTPKIDLFPNPAIEEINIVTEGEVLWGVSEVIDLTGKRIATFPTGVGAPAAGVHKQTINISGLKAGIYILRFKTDKETYARRFQIVK